jgi:hypothetical protein
VRGRKIGELFLKAAFYYATNNHIENIFITVKKGEQQPLVDMLKDFGFFEIGVHNNDISYVKSHPMSAPIDSEAMALSPFCYHRKYFPHYREDENIQKLIIPIKPEYHAILFPDCPVPHQLELFSAHSDVGNAIKLAYLCHAPLSKIYSGDIIMFYRSTDFKILTTIGVVEDFFISQSAEEIAGIVSRRTVYNFEEIKKMARKPTRVILFRLIKHFAKPLGYKWLKSQKIVSGNIQTIRLINTEKYNRIRDYV